MDLGTVIGLVLSIGAVLVSVIMEGGHLGALVNPSAALIVFGGTLGATAVSVSLKQLINLPKITMHAFLSRIADPRDAIELLVSLAQKARREGILALEQELDSLEDDFIKRGIQLVVDGSDPDVVRETMETEIAAMQERHKAGAEVYMTMGGFAPTLGIIGTVMGLVHMLGKLSDPGTMGPAIAAAFIATLYGVSSANLIYLPLASKLQLRSKEEAAICEMMLQGILSLQAGGSPRALEDRLRAYLSPDQRQADTAAQTETADQQPESTAAPEGA